MKPTHHHVPPLGHDLPTFRNQVHLCTNFIFPALSARWPADALHIKYVQNYPVMCPSLNLCLRCTTSHGMVEDKQSGYETFIAPALMINNIAVFAQMSVTYNYCTAAYIIAMAVVLYVAKTWVQKNEFRICCDL